ncbi:unnamed protein product, partial [Polarella glacialis]
APASGLRALSTEDKARIGQLIKVLAQERRDKETYKQQLGQQASQLHDLERERENGRRQESQLMSRVSRSLNLLRDYQRELVASRAGSVAGSVAGSAVYAPGSLAAVDAGRTTSPAPVAAVDRPLSPPPPPAPPLPAPSFRSAPQVAPAVQARRATPERAPVVRWPPRTPASSSSAPPGASRSERDATNSPLRERAADRPTELRLGSCEARLLGSPLAASSERPLRPRSASPTTGLGLGLGPGTSASAAPSCERRSDPPRGSGGAGCSRQGAPKGAAREHPKLTALGVLQPQQLSLLQRYLSIQQVGGESMARSVAEAAAAAANKADWNKTPDQWNGDSESQPRAADRAGSRDSQDADRGRRADGNGQSSGRSRYGELLVVTPAARVPSSSLSEPQAESASGVGCRSSGAGCLEEPFVGALAPAIGSWLRAPSPSAIP